MMMRTVKSLARESKNLDPSQMSEAIQYAMVRRDPECIQVIKDPSPRIQRTAVLQKPNTIRWIKDASPQLRRDALQREPSTIRYLENPTDDEIKIALLWASSIVYLINKVTKRQIVDACMRDPDLLNEDIVMAKLTKKNVLAIIKKYPLKIFYLKHPDEDIQFAAVEADIRAFDVIDKPSDAVSVYAKLKR